MQFLIHLAAFRIQDNGKKVFYITKRKSDVTELHFDTNYFKFIDFS